MKRITRLLAFLLFALNRVRQTDPSRFRAALALLLAACACLFPVVLIRSISETHIYPAILFFCLAVGSIVRRPLQAAEERSYLQLDDELRGDHLRRRAEDSAVNDAVDDRMQKLRDKMKTSKP